MLKKCHLIPLAYIIVIKFDVAVSDTPQLWLWSLKWNYRLYTRRILCGSHHRNLTDSQYASKALQLSIMALCKPSSLGAHLTIEMKPSRTVIKYWLRNKRICYTKQRCWQRALTNDNRKLIRQDTKTDRSKNLRWKRHWKLFRYLLH